MKTHHSVSLYVVIVAGGTGARMKSDMPKQFLELCGRPILMRSIEAFAAYSVDISVVIVLPVSQIDYWKELCERYDFTVPHRVAAGGDTRFSSVKKGLSLLPDEGSVAIHDGVRPLVSRQTIDRCFKEAERHGNAIPAIPVIDTVREITGDGNRLLDRSNLRLIQTPQVFDIALLKKAYDREYSPDFTDDASVFEKAGHVIRLTEGNTENIKITTQQDLIIAQALL